MQTTVLSQDVVQGTPFGGQAEGGGGGGWVGPVSPRPFVNASYLLPVELAPLARRAGLVPVRCGLTTSYFPLRQTPCHNNIVAALLRLHS